MSKKDTAQNGPARLEPGQPSTAATVAMDDGTGGEGASPPAVAPTVDDDPRWILVEVEAIAGIRSYVEPMLRKSVTWSDVRQKLEGINDVFDLLQEDLRQLWICVVSGQLVACAVSRLDDQPRNRILSLEYLAGDGDDKIDLLMEVAIDWARDQHCRFVALADRKDWPKGVMQKIGFKPTFEVSMLEI